MNHQQLAARVASPFRQPCRLSLLGLALWLGTVGCQTTPAPTLVSCPLPVTEQVQEVLKIVPIGTSREEAIKRMKAAGLGGNFGENQSIFYCDFWNKDEGIRWHLNVTLLFDDEGKLYATRPDQQGAVNPTPRQDKSSSSSQAESPYDPFQ